jgi:hypothetical protein
MDASLSVPFRSDLHSQCSDFGAVLLSNIDPQQHEINVGILLPWHQPLLFTLQVTFIALFRVFLK